MHAPLAQHLTRFSRLPPAGASTVPPPKAPAIAEDIEPTVTMTVAAFEARLAEATRRLRTELETTHAAERAHADAAQAEAMAAAIAAASAKRDAEDGETIAAEVRSALDGLRASVCETLANALRPLFVEAAAAKACVELVDALRSILANPDHPILTVKGPPVRLAAVATALGDDATLAFVADESSEEIAVTANGIRIETRLSEAVSALSGSV